MVVVVVVVDVIPVLVVIDVISVVVVVVDVIAVVVLVVAMTYLRIKVKSLQYINDIRIFCDVIIHDRVQPIIQARRFYYCLVIGIIETLWNREKQTFTNS